MPFRRPTQAVVLVFVVVFVAIGSSSAAAPPSKGAKYSYDRLVGKLMSFEFAVSRRGDSIKNVLLLIQMQCSNGREGVAVIGGGLQDFPTKLPVSPQGEFSLAHVVGEQSLEPFILSEEYWISGRFIRSGKAASVTVRSRVVGEAGTVCDTGERHFTA